MIIHANFKDTSSFLFLIKVKTLILKYNLYTFLTNIMSIIPPNYYQKTSEVKLILIIIMIN